jgi:hypothetical protein
MDQSLELGQGEQNQPVFNRLRDQLDLNAIDREIANVEAIETHYRCNLAAFLPGHDWRTADFHEIFVHPFGVQMTFEATMLLNSLAALRQDVQVINARDAFVALCVRDIRQRAEKEAMAASSLGEASSSEASSPKRVTLDAGAQAQALAQAVSPPMPVLESLAHADPWLLRRIVNMACDCREDGTPLSMIAAHEWRATFDAH